MATSVEIYRIIRDQIQHEDSLVAQRLNWLIMSQSFLFTAYAIIVTARANLDSTGSGAPGLDFLLIIVPAIGVLSAIIIAAAIAAGLLAMARLRARWDSFAAGGDVQDLPPIQGGRSTRYMGFAAPVALPAVFALVWLVVLLVR